MSKISINLNVLYILLQYKSKDKIFLPNVNSCSWLYHLVALESACCPVKPAPRIFWFAKQMDLKSIDLYYIIKVWIFTIFQSSIWKSLLFQSLRIVSQNAQGMTGVIIYEIAHPAIPAPGEGV